MEQLTPCRPAMPADAATIARIYSEGIEDRIATFETQPRSESDVLGWFERPQPIVVVEEAGNVAASVDARSPARR
jgi:L-amino acid N-acyltransferase YncA